MRVIHRFNPTAVSIGSGVASRIGRLVLADGLDSVLLVTGRTAARRTGALASVEAALTRRGIRCVHFPEARPNPDLAEVALGVRLVRTERLAGVLAVGAGAAVDLAKAIAAGALLDDPRSLFPDRREIKIALPIHVVSIQPSSGSHANAFALIGDRGRGRKWGVRGPALFPKAALVEIRALAFMTPASWFGALADAFAHALEHALGPKATRTGFALAQAILSALADCAGRLKADPTDESTRLDFALAATAANDGTLASACGVGDWTMHRLAHGLAAQKPECGHGLILAALLDPYLDRLRFFIPDRVVPLTGLVQTFTQCLARFQAPPRLRDLHFGPDDFARALDHSAEEHPDAPPCRAAALSRDDLLAVLEAAY